MKKYLILLVFMSFNASAEWYVKAGLGYTSSDRADTSETALAYPVAPIGYRHTLQPQPVTTTSTNPMLGDFAGGYRGGMFFGEIQHLSRTQADDEGLNMACAGVHAGELIYGNLSACFADGDILDSDKLGRIQVGVRWKSLFFQHSYYRNGGESLGVWGMGVEGRF